MNIFENKFKQLLKEADELGDELERDAMIDSLEDDTEEGAFDVNMEPQEREPGNTRDLTAKVAVAQAEHAAAMVHEIESWVGQFTEFLEFLNGTTDMSIQSILAASEPDTILDRMKQSEQRKIARVATELAALTESFKGYLAQSENPQFKYV